MQGDGEVDIDEWFKLLPDTLRDEIRRVGAKLVQVSHGVQLQSLWAIPTAAVS